MIPRARTTVIITALLAMGFIVNVVISWLCASADRNEPGEVDRLMALRVADVRRWIDRSPGDRLLQFAPSRIGGGMGVTRTEIEAEPPYLPHRWHRVEVIEAGWPLTALEGERWSTKSDDRQSLLVSAIEPPGLGLGDNCGGGLLPMRPIWPGLASNTLLFATLIWISVMLMPRWARRSVRQRAGRCPNCSVVLTDPCRTRCESCGWLRGVANWREIPASEARRASGPNHSVRAGEDARH